MLRPIKSTGDVTYIKPGGREWYEHRDGPRRPGDGIEAKLKTIQHVKNVVKVEL